MALKLAYTVFQSQPAARLSSLRPMLIIHGLFGSKKNWESISKAFSKSGLQVITVDARNHGDSPHADAMDYHSMSSDIVQLLADLKIDKVNLLGHSMGGKIAMTLALTQQSLVDKLIIEDISPTFSQSTGIPEAISVMKSINFKEPSLSAIHHARKFADQRLSTCFPDKATRDFILTNIVGKPGEFRWRMNIAAISNGLDNILGFPVFDQVYPRTCLFVGGSLSSHISEPFYPDIRRLFPKAQIQHIAGAGHWVHAEKPYDFMAMVESFLLRSSSEL